MNVVSEIKGPNAFILNLFSFFIAGIIILISSDFFLNSALCGLSPNIPILGFFLKIFLKYLLRVMLLY